MTTNFFHPSLSLLFLDPGSEIRDPGSVMGKNQDPGSGINIQDPQQWFFGPPGSASRSISQIQRSGSFYHQAKIVRKTWIPTVFLLLFYFLSLKNDVPSKSNRQKNNFLLSTWRSLTKITGSGSASWSISQRYGCADPDPHPDLYQNFMDPQHCKMLNAKSCNAVLTTTSISFFNFFLPHLRYLGLRNRNVP